MLQYSTVCAQYLVPDGPARLKLNLQGKVVQGCARLCQIDQQTSMNQLAAPYSSDSKQHHSGLAPLLLAAAAAAAAIRYL